MTDTSFERDASQSSSDEQARSGDASDAATSRVGVTGDQLRAASKVVEFAVRKEQARFKAATA
jgi:hypothetical protein